MTAYVAVELMDALMAVLTVPKSAAAKVAHWAVETAGHWAEMMVHSMVDLMAVWKAL
jgi:hypothetical protein